MSEDYGKDDKMPLCFYCKTNRSTENDAYKHTLYYVANKMKLWVGYRYSAQVIVIPRCAECRRKHDSFGWVYLLALLIGFAFWFWIFYRQPSGGSIWTCAFGAFWLTVFTVLIPMVFLVSICFHAIKKIPHEEDFDDYPPAKRLLSDGWLKSRPDPANAEVSRPDEN